MLIFLRRFGEEMWEIRENSWLETFSKIRFVFELFFRCTWEANIWIYWCPWLASSCTTKNENFELFASPSFILKILIKRHFEMNKKNKKIRLQHSTKSPSTNFHQFSVIPVCPVRVVKMRLLWTRSTTNSNFSFLRSFEGGGWGFSASLLDLAKWTNSF